MAQFNIHCHLHGRMIAFKKNFVIQSGGRIITATFDLKCFESSKLNSLPQGTHSLKIIETAQIIYIKYLQNIFPISFFSKRFTLITKSKKFGVETNFSNISCN